MPTENMAAANTKNLGAKVFGVSSCHVLREKTEGTYVFKGAGAPLTRTYWGGAAPRQYVRVNGLRRFQRGLAEIKACVSDYGMLAQLYPREVIKLEGKGTSDDEENAEDARELHKTRQDLDEQVESSRRDRCCGAR